MERKKKIKIPKINEEIISKLEEAAEKVGLEVRYEQISKPGYPGGVCRVKDKWVVIINRASFPVEKAQVIAEAIMSKNPDNVYLPPDVREVIEWFSLEKERSSNDKNPD